MQLILSIAKSCQLCQSCMIRVIYITCDLIYHHYSMLVGLKMSKFASLASCSECHNAFSPCNRDEPESPLPNEHPVIMVHVVYGRT